MMKANNMRGGIDRSAFKGDNKDDTELWYKHNFGVGRKDGVKWETKKGMKTTTKRERMGSMRNKRGGGVCRCRQYKIRQSEEGREPILARQMYQEVKHSDRTD